MPFISDKDTPEVDQKTLNLNIVQECIGNFGQAVQ